MSHPPNSPEVARRSPQHGITTTYPPTPPNSPASTPHPSRRCSPISTPLNTHARTPATKGPAPLAEKAVTVRCAQLGCGNTVDVIPFGDHVQMHVRVSCKECQRPVITTGAAKTHESVEAALDGEWREDVEAGGVEGEVKKH